MLTLRKHYIEIVIDFQMLTWQEEDTFKLRSSLAVTEQIVEVPKNWLTGVGFVEVKQLDFAESISEYLNNLLSDC